MIQAKRGDTLTILVKRTDAEGTPLTGDALKLKSQVRTATDKLLGEFTIVETETLGTYKLTLAPSITKTFPIGSVFWDLQYDNGAGLISSSRTLEIEIVKDVTHE